MVSTQELREVLKETFVTGGTGGFTKEEYDKLFPQSNKLVDDMAEYLLRTETPIFVINIEKTKQAIIRARDRLREMGF